jgi:hypothetical protein
MSVLYCRTSVPPVFSIQTPFIVFGMEAIVPMLALNLVTGEITKCELSEASLAEAIDNEAVGVKRVTRDKRDMYEGIYRGRGEWPQLGAQ